MIFNPSNDNFHKDGYKFLNGLYFHGIVEKSVGFDCVEIDEDNFKSFNEMLEKNGSIFNLPVNVNGYNGIPVLFAWKSNHHPNFYRGLIVESSNVDDVEFAISHFKRQSQML